MKVNLEQKPKTYVVINPVAGLSQLEIVRERVQSALQEREIPFEIYETTGKEDLREMVRDKIQQGFKLFIAAGGDGTLSAVVDGLAGTQIPFVIVPTGTWNALARALDIPLQLEAAIDLLFQEHQVRAIDAIQVDKRFFVLSVSAGIGSRTMKDAERQEKRRLGKLSDLRRGVTELLKARSYQFEVKIDGNLAKFRASELLVTNSAILGLKAVQLDPNIRMDDGKLNVCRIYAKTVGDYLRVGFSMLTGSQKRNWNMSCVEVADEVEVRCKQKLPVQGDGDMIGYLPITAKVRPKAIYIVTPVNAET
jgi:YegS/Rv2252/BmrU family lipid kinase